MGQGVMMFHLLQNYTGFGAGQQGHKYETAPLRLDSSLSSAFFY
jgi:hypothetical protein